MHDYADWVQTRYSGSGQFCCDLSDGRPVHDGGLRVVDGHYQVFYASAHWTDGTDQWLEVPDGAILHTPNPVGMPIAWILAGRVYCLSLSGAV